jgi:trk system potassium uptake protein TrkA
MHIIVVGCGRAGSELAYRLFKRGHSIAVVDEVAAAFEKLPADYRGRVVQGEVLSRDVLHRAGIEEADGVAVVTNSDTVNAVLAHVARTVFNVPNVVVRSYDPRSIGIHEVFGLQAVSSTRWGAERIEDLLAHSAARTVFSAGNGEVQVYELMVPEEWEGFRLHDLLPEGNVVPVALTRGAKAIIPSRGLELLPCDVLHVAATRKGMDDLRQRLPNPSKRH